MNRVAWLALVVSACSSPPSHDSPDAAVDSAIQVGCGAPTGDFHSQMLAMGDGIEDRYYWMHVPAAYSCTAPMPMLVDFHGTAGDVPEEAYETPALIAFSDATGVIVVRPRSRSSDEGGSNIYRWDENTGDIARNITYARNLVADLEQHYAIDPARVYGSGFSSGSNMAAQFLSDAQSPFKGLAPIAGGEWSTGAVHDQTTGPYVFMSTGYRDYLWPTAKDLIAELATAHQPADHLCVRHTGGGHDLYPWHFAELWQFLDGHTCPGSGTATTPWTVSTLPDGTDVNAFALSGTTLVAAGAHGKTWTYTGGGWVGDLARDDADYTALCFGPTHAFVGGDYRAAFGTATTWSAGTGFPDYGMLGAGWANAASCLDDGSVIVVGYWSAALTADGGTTWSQFHEPTMYPGVEAQLAGVGTSAGGATVSVGYYDYIGRTPGGQTTAVVIAHPNPAAAEWWNGVTALPGGTFWVVGDNGSILKSVDDGQTWQTQASHTTENLYAVSFFDAGHGAAVGRRGTVVVTSDGGTSWTPRLLGKDVYLGAVHVDATTVWIAGEGGLVATSPR